MKVELSAFEWLAIVTQPCKLCGGFSLKKVEGDTYIVCNSVDRIDSRDRVYHIANCQPLCLPCNLGKRELTDEQFEQHILKIVTNKPHLIDQVVRFAARTEVLSGRGDDPSGEGQQAVS